MMRNRLWMPVMIRRIRRSSNNEKLESRKAPSARAFTAWSCLLVYLMLTLVGGAERLLLCHEVNGRTTVEPLESAQCGGLPAASNLPAGFHALSSVPGAGAFLEDACGPCTDTPLFVAGSFYSYGKDLPLQLQGLNGSFGKAPVFAQSTCQRLSADLPPAGGSTLGSIRTVVLLI